MNRPQLNPEQEQAVLHNNGPLLIVAGAGTGKTTVITQKIARLITENLAKPEEILALTFTEKAAFEMLTRVEEALGLSFSDIQISTFHAFCQRVLETHGMDIGLPTPFKLVTELQAWFLVKEHFKTFNLDYYRPLSNPTRHIHQLIKHFSKCKDELVSPQAYLAHAENLKLDQDDELRQERDRLLELANAYHRYERLLLERTSLDFGDLIYYMVKLLEERPAIRAKLRRRFKYILVDEFQDVNYAQYRLVQLLTDQTSHLTIVGDDDQSIYAFRGASVGNILHFKDDFPQATAIVLNRNYRSSQSILDAAYRVIQNNNPDRLEAKLSIDKKLIAHQNDTPDAIEVVMADNHKAEVQAFIDRVLELKKTIPDFSWNDTALLSRASSHAEPFIEAMRANGIPFVTAAATSLFHEPIVMDALAVFRAALNIHDPHALFRLLHLKVLDLSDHDLQKLFFSAKKKSISYFDALKRATEFGLFGEAAGATEKLMAWVQHAAHNSRTLKPTQVLYAFLEESGYLAYLTHEEAHGDGSIVATIDALTRFFEQLTAYEANHPSKATIAEFMEFHESLLEAGDEGEEGGEQPDASGGIQVMTVHASKGLEFKYVFIVNLVEERFPVRKRSEPLEVPRELIKETPPSADAHYQEERRLFYVAVTRARERVVLLGARDYGGARAKKASRFLIEMGWNDHESDSPRAKESSKIPAKPNQPITVGTAVYDTGTTFSFSQLRSYETCPYQYKLNYVLKVPTKGSPHFSFGQSMHVTLQKFYIRVQELNSARQVSLFAALEPAATEAKTPSLEELYRIYEECWIDDWYQSTEQRESYYKKGKEILATFYREHGEHARIPLMLEGWFKINIGGYFLNGRIDRIDRLPDGSLEIIDYKTGQAKDKLSSEDKEQLLIYQIAAEQLPEYRNQGKPSALTFYYLNDNVKISFLGEQSELEKLKEKLVEIIERIRAGDFTPSPNSFTCAHCDFRSICEFRA